MKIELTKAQYKTLLIMTFCGEWMLNSYKTKEDKISKDTDNLEQYLFSLAAEAGFDNWVEYDNGLAKYFPTLKMEEDMQPFLHKYNKRQKEI